MRTVKKLELSKRRWVVRPRRSLDGRRWLRFFGQTIATRLAWRTNGLGTHSGLRHGDGRPRAADADRISGRRKSHPEGPGEGAAEALGCRASHARRNRSSIGPQG